MNEPLRELLGAKRTDDLKDKICELIINRIDDDLADYQDYLFAPEDITAIAEEALDEVRDKIKKKFKKKYLDVAELAVQKIEHNSLCETETYEVGE